MMNDDLPPRDHNQPPKFPELLARVNECVKAANVELARTKLIRNAEQAGLFQGFVQQLRDLASDLDVELGKELAPLKEAEALARAPYRDPVELIKLTRIKVQPLIDDWLAREKVRLEDERQRAIEAAHKAQLEADRLRKAAEQPDATIEQQLAAKRTQEAADKLLYAAGRKPKRAMIKGEYGGKAMSMQKRWVGEVTDIDAAFAFYRNHDAVRETLTKLASADARRLKDPRSAPPGCVFKQVETAV